MDEKVIVGNVVGVPNPKSDWNQNDPTKADFIKNKPDIESKLAEKADKTEVYKKQNIVKNVTISDNTIRFGEYPEGEGPGITIHTEGGYGESSIVVENGTVDAWGEVTSYDDSNHPHKLTQKADKSLVDASRGVWIDDDLMRIGMYDPDTGRQEGPNIVFDGTEMYGPHKILVDYGSVEAYGEITAHDDFGYVHKLTEKADASLIDGSDGVYICPEEYNAQIVTEYSNGRNGTILINGLGDFVALDGDVKCNKSSKEHRLSKKADVTYVDEKIAEIGTGGGGSGQEQWRLINDITLTEDAVVEFTTDADGNAFELKKMRILVKVPTLATQSQLWLKTGDYIAVYSDNIPTSANTPAVSIDGELKNAWIFTTCYSASGRYNAGTVKSFPSGTRHSNGESVLVDPIKKIALAFSSNMTTPIVSGTKIQFWGVDA